MTKGVNRFHNSSCRQHTEFSRRVTSPGRESNEKQNTKTTPWSEECSETAFFNFNYTLLTTSARRIVDRRDLTGLNNLNFYTGLRRAKNGGGDDGETRFGGSRERT